MFWCKVDIVEGSIIVVDSCQCIRWIEHQKKRLQTHRVAVNFLQNARLRKISWFVFPFALRIQRVHVTEMERVRRFFLSFLDFVYRIMWAEFGIAQYWKNEASIGVWVKRIIEHEMLMFIFLMMMLLLSLNFGRPHKKMTFTYAATQAK